MARTATGVCEAEARADMPGLAGCYLQFCAGHLGDLEKCIARHDLTSVCRIAQTLTGNAGQVGLNELSSLGRQLEEYCVGNDWRAIDSAYRVIAETILKLRGERAVRIAVATAPSDDVQKVNVKNAS